MLFREPTFLCINSAQQRLQPLPHVAQLPRLPRYGHQPGIGLIRNGRTTVGKSAMSILSEIFSWWGGNTWGTRITLMCQGRFVGEDDDGNKYYEQRSGVGSMGMPRRWVTYKHQADPTRVPPEWHGWLHHTVNTPPTEEDYRPKPWQQEHRANMTGTAAAYRPSGSILTSDERPHATGDYQAWKPD